MAQAPVGCFRLIVGRNRTRKNHLSRDPTGLHGDPFESRGPKLPLKMEDGASASWMLPIDSWKESNKEKSLVPRPYWLTRRSIRIERAQAAVEDGRWRKRQLDASD